MPIKGSAKVSTLKADNRDQPGCHGDANIVIVDNSQCLMQGKLPAINKSNSSDRNSTG